MAVAASGRRCAPYERDDRPYLHEDGTLPPVVEDALDLASQAFLLDRDEPRGEAGEQAWHRSLALEVAVRRPELWSSPAVHDAVLALLHWITDDDWSVRFWPAATLQRHVQPRLAVDTYGREVALFSGGLDSTAGAALQLAAGVRLLGVAVVTNPMMKHYQSSVARELQAVHGDDLAVSYSSFYRRAVEHQEDPTRRTRGLVFLVHGWARAVAARRDRLLVLENGIGAINLPFVGTHWGCMTSRAVHPRTLLLAQRLFSLLGDAQFSVVNPHLHETKAEMCRRLPPEAAEACRASASCDAAAAGRSWRDRRCGRCSSCLLRQITLSDAGRTAWDSPYGSPVDAQGSALPRMLHQAARMATALRASDAEAALARAFPALADVPAEVIGPGALVRLYREHVLECSRFPHPLVRSFLRPTPLAA